MEIKLLEGEKIISSLKNAIEESVSVNASTAFWTIFDSFDIEYFVGKLKNLLSNDSSYFCCDVSTTTTNIDAIDSYAKYGCNFYIYSFKLSKILEEHPPTLLHSKIMLFKTKDHKAIIFIGSHNMTNRALRGINMEHTLQIVTECDSEIAIQVEQALEEIKKECILYDSNKKHIYKWLQDGVDIDAQIFMQMLFLHVTPHEFKDIDIGKIISLVSFDKLELNNNKISDFKERDRNVLLTIFTDSGEMKIFESELTGTNTTDVNIASSGDNTIGTDFWGLWIRSLTSNYELPVYLKKTEYISRNVFDIGSTHFYKFVLKNEVDSIMKVGEGFRNKISVWLPLESGGSEYFNKRTSTDNAINFSKYLNQIDNLTLEKGKIKQEPKILQINHEIFSENFLETMRTKNKSAFTKVNKEDLIDLQGSTFKEGKNIFANIFQIILESLNTEEKLSRIEALINHTFPELSKAKTDKDYFKNKRKETFRNMKDRFLMV